MYAVLSIDLENDAFKDATGNETKEVAQILRALADRLERHERCHSPIGLTDTNGNSVGMFKLIVGRNPIK